MYFFNSCFTLVNYLHFFLEIFFLYSVLSFLAIFMFYFIFLVLYYMLYLLHFLIWQENLEIMVCDVLLQVVGCFLIIGREFFCALSDIRRQTVGIMAHATVDKD